MQEQRSLLMQMLIANARKKLKDHQDRKNTDVQKGDIISSNDHRYDISMSEPDPERSPDNQSEKDLFDSMHSLQYKQDEKIMLNQADVSATEFLVSSKRNLELQMVELQTKNTELEKNLIATTEKYETQCQKVRTLQNELYNTNINYNTAIEQLQIKDKSIKELNNSKGLVFEEKTNIQEQLEFTKTILKAKEVENDSLHSQLYNIQGQFDAAQLQLQQLTNGTHDTNNPCSQEVLRHENEMLMQKVASLEQQLKSQLKDYQQINSQYEQYVGELNEQLNSVTQKNEDLNRELQNLSNRENALIEQISEMEIRLQNYSRAFDEKPAVSKVDDHCYVEEFNKLKSRFEKNQELLQQVSKNYEELQKLYNESKEKIVEITQSKELECKQNNEVSLLKLSADITSDKVAAQRATEQNKKLKIDLQGLEETVLKMTKDKLELTEKLTAEKYLNRELTIKLAEIDEKSNNLHTTLKAKDEEMIRLQASFRDLEKVHEEMKQTMDFGDHKECLNNNHNGTQADECKNIENEKNKNNFHNDICENKPLIECTHETGPIPKGDAMLKLQERFLKIMGEVADLSDEKHRLEHIIMQLQNETETICEYVALYQQQRSLLKKRDEERTAQIKIFQSECKRLQDQLDEMAGILKRFAEDKELSSYFQIQAKHEDLQKVMSLLSNLKTSSILDPKRTIELNNYYPCSCCSGQLIDV